MTSRCQFDLAALRRDYGDIPGEARACRSAAALFDFSFMRRLRIEGRGAIRVAQSLTPRPVAHLARGRIAYALGLDAAGRAVVDLTIWKVEETVFEIFSPHDHAQALARAAAKRASVHDLTADTAIFSVQGPQSLRALAGAAPSSTLRALSYFAHVDTSVAGIPCRVGRLGYTGERGFEVVAPRQRRDVIWAALAQGARPAGFASADMLRIEAGFLLFANELRFMATPAELGLERFAQGPRDRRGGLVPACERRVRLICFRADCENDPILWQPAPGTEFPPAPGAIVVTSACRSVVAGGVLGLGYVRLARRSGDVVDPTGQFQRIREAGLPFFDPAKRRPRGEWRADLTPDIAHSAHSAH